MLPIGRDWVKGIQEYLCIISYNYVNLYVKIKSLILKVICKNKHILILNLNKIRECAKHSNENMVIVRLAGKQSMSWEWINKMYFSYTTECLQPQK